MFNFILRKIMLYSSVVVLGFVSVADASNSNEENNTKVSKKRKRSDSSEGSHDIKKKRADEITNNNNINNTDNNKVIEFYNEKIKGKEYEYNIRSITGKTRTEKLTYYENYEKLAPAQKEKIIKLYEQFSSNPNESVLTIQAGINILPSVDKKIEVTPQSYNTNAEVNTPTGRQLCQIVFNKMSGNYQGADTRPISLVLSKITNRHLEGRGNTAGSSYFSKDVLPGINEMNVLSVVRNMLHTHQCRLVGEKKTDGLMGDQTGCRIECSKSQKIGYYDNGDETSAIFFSINPNSSYYEIYNIYPDAP